MGRPSRSRTESSRGAQLERTAASLLRRSGTSAPRWMRQRARTLQSACQFIHKLRARGLSMVKARQRAIDRFNGRALADGKKLRLSVPTIERHFYRWVKAPARVSFLTPLPPAKVDIECLKSLVALCLREGLVLGEGYRREAARGVAWPFCYRSALRHARALGLLEILAQRRCLRRELAALQARAAKQVQTLLSSLSAK